MGKNEFGAESAASTGAPAPRAAAIIALTGAQMSAHERAIVDSGKVTGAALMARAGAGVAAAIRAARPTPGRARVLCGPGNNGGDGYVIARLLRAQGWEIALHAFGDPAGLPPDARAAHDQWRALGSVHDLEAEGGLRGAAPADVTVDALFGTGLSRPLPAWLRRDVLDVVADRPAGVLAVAVDIPSGLCADSGRVLLPATEAGPDAPPARDHVGRPDFTVTFHAPKRGHLLADGPGACGTLCQVDIGLPPLPAGPDMLRLVGADGLGLAPEALPPEGAAALDKAGTEAGRAHKFGFGHALCLTGGAGRTGAARLSARAALRAGVGLVTLGVPGDAAPEVAAQITAEMMTRIDTRDDLARVLEDPRITALCLGPGLGKARARALVPDAVRACTSMDRGLVLDADALSAFADDPETLFSMLGANCVLTPHGGELARLFPDLADRLAAPADRGPAYSRADAARAAAARAGCVVLLKGPDTVIAGPAGACALHLAAGARAAPWLATAGAGDVLSGLITGLLARGIPAMRAAELASWLHVEAARAFGPGLIASDLPDAIPFVLRSLRA